MSSLPHIALSLPGVAARQWKQTEVTNPYTGEAIATVDMADKAAVETALQTSHALFTDRKQWLSVPQRLAILEKALYLMQQQSDELARGAAEEGGKPLIDSKVEMARCIDSIRHCMDTLRHQTSHPVPMGVNPASQHRLTMLHKEPIGVVVAISAFNHPLNLIAHQVGPAIAAGCPVIVKPAENTPLSCFRLVDIFHQAGLPAEWCQALLTENHQIAEQLATDPRVAFLSFIGSAKVGWYLRSKLAPGTRCALEHGGVAPVIIDEKADIDAAVPGLAKGSFYHAGQVCVSVQRIFVHHSLARELADKLAAAGEKCRLAIHCRIKPKLARSFVQVRSHEWMTGFRKPSHKAPNLSVVANHWQIIATQPRCYLIRQLKPKSLSMKFLAQLSVSILIRIGMLRLRRPTVWILRFRLQCIARILIMRCIWQSVWMPRR